MGSVAISSVNPTVVTGCTSPAANGRLPPVNPAPTNRQNASVGTSVLFGPKDSSQTITVKQTVADNTYSGSFSTKSTNGKPGSQSSWNVGIANQATLGTVALIGSGPIKVTRELKAALGVNGQQVVGSAGASVTAETKIGSKTTLSVKAGAEVSAPVGGNTTATAGGELRVTQKIDNSSLAGWISGSTGGIAYGADALFNLGDLGLTATVKQAGDGTSFSTGFAVNY